jgi:hypothetical protein
MAAFLAVMLTTVEEFVTHLPTIKDPSPSFNQIRFTAILLCHSLLTFQLLVSRRAHHRCLNLSAIATSFHGLFTSPAKPFVAWTRTAVLSTRHHIAAYFATAPGSDIVVCLCASSSSLMFTAEAALGGAHMRARRAWTGVTYQITWMRTRLGNDSKLATRLTTRVWR